MGKDYFELMQFLYDESKRSKDYDRRECVDHICRKNNDAPMAFDDFKICPDFDCDCFTMNFQQVIGCWTYKPKCNCVMLLRFKETNR